MKNEDSPRRWCAQLQDDDGVDPRRYFAKHQRQRSDRKAHQLCRQAHRVLSLIFPNEFPDHDLRELTVVGVIPGPDASRLTVQIGSQRPLTAHDGQRTLLALQRAKGRLRHEVAAAITRRRAPDLSFELICLPGGAS